MDVMEAISLGLDCVCIAGTGASKTMPFMMPLLLEDNEARVLVISPLKILQEEQARHFVAMGISATAVNGDNWNKALHQKLEDGQYRALITSTEMCLKHEAFRSLLAASAFSKSLAMVVVDEAHCISQWGREFRKDYAELAKLQFFILTTIPFLATSTTLPPRHSRRDFDAVLPLLTQDGKWLTTLLDIIKMYLFVNKVGPALELCQFIKAYVLQDLKQHIDSMFALQMVSAKWRVMKEFTEGTVKVLIATEASGMGVDIPNIEQVIQLGVPSSLSVWVQRAGRAGSSPQLQARAILLVEKSTFKQQKANLKSKEVGEDSLEWVKKVESAIWEWIECPKQQHQLPNTSVDPPDSPGNIPQGSNTDDNNNNNNNNNTPDNGPKLRRGEHCESVHLALMKWHFKMKKSHYSPSSYTAAAILPDPVIAILSSHSTVKTIIDLKQHASYSSIVAEAHFQELVVLIESIDQAREAEKAAKALELEEKQAEKLCLDEERCLESIQRWEEKKLRTKEARELKAKLEKEEKARVRAEAKKQREAEAQARKDKAKAKRLLAHAVKNTPVGLHAFATIIEVNASPATPHISSQAAKRQVQCCYNSDTPLPLPLPKTLAPSCWGVGNLICNSEGE
ncbi:P-loop containing nucleoside triphosphate hydrolase protein [Ephemerocybe angulata]|uniref:DNA 3'-5' helicase n=1 Tax=Ephemerocybe angulata TaxID=980116 RepID=A0A8H6IKT7_9AGAR|nr:P-loop containing nucleoside triphosphate hydrolase protein [Tulosesus angulatus]